MPVLGRNRVIAYLTEQAWHQTEPCRCFCGRCRRVTEHIHWRGGLLGHDVCLESAFAGAALARLATHLASWQADAVTFSMVQWTSGDERCARYVRKKNMGAKPLHHGWKSVSRTKTRAPSHLVEHGWFHNMEYRNMLHTAKSRATLLHSLERQSDWQFSGHPRFAGRVDNRPAGDRQGH